MKKLESSFENNNQEYFELKLSQEENYYNQQITDIKRFSIELENDFSIDEPTAPAPTTPALIPAVNFFCVDHFFILILYTTI